MDEIKQDVKDIKAAVGELVKQGAIHNHILAEHEKRSTLLEERVKPLENDLQFRTKLTAVLTGGSGALAVIATAMGIYAAIRAIL